MLKPGNTIKVMTEDEILSRFDRDDDGNIIFETMLCIPSLFKYFKDAEKKYTVKEIDQNGNFLPEEISGATFPSEIVTSVTTEVVLNEDDIPEDIKEKLDEIISEEISNKTGFCHKGFSYRIVIDAELDTTE